MKLSCTLRVLSLTALFAAGAAQAASSGTLGPQSTTVDVVGNVTVTSANPGVDIPEIDGRVPDKDNPYTESYGGPVQGLRTLDIGH